MSLAASQIDFIKTNATMFNSAEGDKVCIARLDLVYHTETLDCVDNDVFKLFFDCDGLHVAVYDTELEELTIVNEHAYEAATEYNDLGVFIGDWEEVLSIMLARKMKVYLQETYNANLLDEYDKAVESLKKINKIMSADM